MPIHPNVRQCNHIKINGVRCGSPAVTGAAGCYFHANVLRKVEEFILPPLEDSNAVQFCVMEVMRGLLEKRLDRATANSLLYALQIAQNNLRGLTVTRNDEDHEVEVAKNKKASKKGGQNSDGDDDDEGDGAHERREASLTELLLRELDDCGGNTDEEIGAALNRPRKPQSDAPAADSPAEGKPSAG